LTAAEHQHYIGDSVGITGVIWNYENLVEFHVYLEHIGPFRLDNEFGMGRCECL